MTSTTIHVYLPDELVDAWRPVSAALVRGSVYRILEQPYDHEIEKWEFEPGELVQCEVVELSDGPELVAVRRDPSPAS